MLDKAIGIICIQLSVFSVLYFGDGLFSEDGTASFYKSGAAILAMVIAMVGGTLCARK